MAALPAPRDDHRPGRRGRPTRPPVGLVRSAVALVASAVLAAGCGGDDDPAVPASTTRPPQVTSTTAAEQPRGPAVEPAVVPEGHRALRAPGIGVGVAVPDGWTITDLRGDDLTAAQAEAAASDPQLSGLLADGGALLEDAVALAAIGPTSATGTPLVTLIQLPVIVEAVPDDVVADVREQVAGYGATDVVVDQVEVPGLPDGRRALRVAAVLTVDGVAQRLQATIVPTTVGLAVVTVRDGGAQLDAIASSLAAS